MSGPAEGARAEVEVGVGRDAAFAGFVALDRWWPREFTWSADALEHIGITPRAGGLCTEIGPGGFRVDWGRVTGWEPPGRLELAWQIGPDRAPRPDPAAASTVEVRLIALGPAATRVEVVHTGFDRYGEDGEGYRRAMHEQGWPYALGRYAEALDGPSGR